VVRSDDPVGEDVDWTKLSRKHEVESDAGRSVITIFGGKLTDCLNVGEEIADAVEALGVPLEPDTHNWYGEPVVHTRAEFFRQARLMHLDDLRSTEGLEALSERLWRRYGRRAFGMLDEIRKDPAMGEDIIESADYVRVEVHLAADTEMVTKLEDFLRRRSKIAQVIPDSDVIGSPGLDEAVRILFGDQAEEKLDEYLRDHEIPVAT
jgi:glycerol-3-phosphate dehydrogenase